MSIIGASKSAMTHRERFLRLMHYQTVDRGVHWEFGYLQETIDRWHQEGLPVDITAGEGAGRNLRTRAVFHGRHRGRDPAVADRGLFESERG